MPAGGITDAGRTYAEQLGLFLARYTTNYEASSKRDRRWFQGKNWWRKVGVASAATPGYSKHETGRALDLAGSARDWARTHGKAYGWIADLVRDEPWHLEYQSVYDKRASGPPPVPPVTVPEPTTPPAPQHFDIWELEMTSFIEDALAAAYRAETGRDPSRAELDPRLIMIALSPDPMAGLRAQITEIDASTESARYFVRTQYETVLGRPGSLPEWDTWINLVGGGDVDTGSKADMIRDGLMNSREYAVRFITMQYRALLGRDPSEADIDRWWGTVSSILAPESNRMSIIAGIKASEEYKRTHPNG